jgi:hypothetical protein
VGSGSRKAEARRAIEQAIRDGWVAAGGTDAELAWQNVTFDPPDVDGSLGAWLEVTLLWGDGGWQTMEHRTSTVGLAQVDVYTPGGRGLGKAHAAADVLGNVLTGLQVPMGTGLKLRFDVASGPVPADSKHEAWARVSVSCPFTLEELRAF